MNSPQDHQPVALFFPGMRQPCPTATWWRYPVIAALVGVCLSGASTFAAGPATKAPAAEAPVKQPATEAADSADPVYHQAVVAADHPAASEAGLAMLRQGGNVVDAAAATSFALAVVRPASCGLGGGGFMVIWNAEKQQAIALDYRERAPHRATRNMFTRAAEASPDAPEALLSRRGGLAVAVPGTVAGLCHAVEHYGKLDLSTVLAPAIRLCEEGVPVDPHMREVQQGMLRGMSDSEKATYAPLVRLYLNEGKPWQAGDRFHSPLGPVLQKIAATGSAGFYSEEVGRALVQAVQQQGGLLEPEDLQNVKPVVRKPVSGEYRGSRIFSMPPPSSGGIALLETLNILEAREQSNAGEDLEKLGHNSPEYIHLVAEAMKHAFADRAEFLGDADVVEVPVARLTSPAYAAQLARRINPDHTRPLKEYGRYLPTTDSGTSHFSVMDARGNAVACTETINTGFGSWVVEPEFGIVLNNEMDDFAAIPGRPNAFGLLQSEANAVAPGKKPLSSMSPTIVVRDGQAIFAA
ncbi:MAG: gamma-glutamyltransferase, partial [Planctomycetaceae bacterium]|nr:gamma-glutamyltransferase [Planctomycetaceae bacterium]